MKKFILSQLHSDGIVECCAQCDGTIDEVSQSYLDLFHLEAPPENFLPLIADEDRARIEEMLHYAKKKPCPCVYREKVIIDYAEREMIWITIPIFLPDGSFSHLYGIGRFF